jgi:hypothetical protein
MKRTYLWLIAAAAVLLAVVVLTRMPRDLARAPKRAARSTLPHETSTTASFTAAVTSISGTVRARGGGAVAGARVCATDAVSQIEWQPAVLCADASPAGEFRIALPAGGGYNVSAEAEGFVPGTAEPGGWSSCPPAKPSRAWW